MTRLDDLRRRLEETARNQRTIHYGEIAPMLGLDMEDPADRVRIAQILRELSKEERREGRPLLSVVVTHKEDERPGKGFYELGKELGLVGSMDEDTFSVHQLKLVHKQWVDG